MCDHCYHDVALHDRPHGVTTRQRDPALVKHWDFVAMLAPLLDTQPLNKQSTVVIETDVGEGSTKKKKKKRKTKYERFEDNAGALRARRSQALQARGTGRWRCSTSLCRQAAHRAALDTPLTAIASRMSRG